MSDDATTETASHPRFRWVDQMRGLAMFYVVVFELSHGDWRYAHAALAFVLAHAPRTATYVTAGDVGAPAFVFVMGLLFSYSFHRRKERAGARGASLHMLYRYGLLLALGVLASFVGHLALTREIPLGGGRTLTVVHWDVLQSLGLAGIVALPFLFLRARWRVAAGYALLVFYQAMLSTETTGWKLFAVHSVHGGILGTAFSLSAQMIVASALGEYLLAGQDVAKVRGRVVLFGALNLAAGVAATWIPTIEATRRQVSLAFSLICIGALSLICILFLALDRKGKRSVLLDALGRNALVVYLVVLFVEYIVFEALLDDATAAVRIGAGVLAATAICAYSLRLHRKYRVIRTERVLVCAVLVLAVVAAVRLVVAF